MRTSIVKISALLSLACTALLSISSCSKVEELIPEPVAGEEMSITAEIPDTKTTNDGMSTVWASGDEISAIHIKTGHSTNYVSKFTYVSGNEFKGTVSNLGSYNDWYVVYPYDANNKKASSISVSVNAAPSQTGVNSTAHLAGANFPLFGKKLKAPKAESGVKITMTNALSVAEFIVTNTLSEPITVTGIDFTSVSEIAGDFSVDMTKDEYVWTAKSGASKTVSLEVSGDAVIAAGAKGTFYAGIVPHDIPAGSQIVVTVNAKREGASVVPCTITKTISADASFTAGLFKSVNLSYEQGQTTGSYKLITSEPSDWSGKYIMVSADKSEVFTGSTETSNRYTLQASDVKDGAIVKNCSEYEFTISKDGSDYYLKHNNQYLYCSFSGSTTGVSYSSTEKAMSLHIMSDGTFGFWMKVGSTEQHLYYKSSSNYFKFGGSHDNHCVYLYKWDDGSPVPPTPVTTKYVRITAEPSDWSGSYIFTDADGKYIFNSEASTDNSYTILSSDLSGNDIIKDCTEYEFTITKDGSDYYLMHDGKYLYCTEDYSEDLGMGYSTSAKALSLTMMNNNTFGFYMYDYTAKKNQYIYYKTSSGYFKFGASHNNNCIRIYKRQGGSSQKEVQNLSFDYSTYTIEVGSTYVIGGTYPLPQTVKGAKTAVTYSSSNKNVATVSGTDITIVGTGSTTITANAEESATYYAGSASFALTIISEGAYNLENKSATSYFDDAASSYTDDNYKTTTVITKYNSSKSSSNRLDVPAPVSLSWESANSEQCNQILSIYNNSAMTELETSVTTSGNSAVIYNLIPGKTYYYKVSASSSTITTGSFSTEGHCRMIKVSDTYASGHANNCRDMGGLKTTDGKTIKYGIIFRGTNMDATTSDEKDYLVNYMKLGLDVDLRNGSTYGTPGKDGSSNAYNAFNGSRDVEYVKGNFVGSISYFYTTNSNAQKNMTNIFTKILAAIKDGKSSYIHCYHGADRTGFVCTLLEAALGVSAKDCSIDYELTSFSVIGTRRRTGADNSLGKDGLNYINEYSKGSTFQEKACNILLDYGITASQITEFKNAMLQ